jgi:hypothetical protein
MNRSGGTVYCWHLKLSSPRRQYGGGTETHNVQSERETAPRVPQQQFRHGSIICAQFPQSHLDSPRSSNRENLSITLAGPRPSLARA